MINLDSILEGVKTVGICGHVKPDGDAYGSCMGLYLFLKAYRPDIQAAVYLEDSYSESFRFIACSDEIVHDYPAAPPHDVFFAIDCSDLQRLGSSQDYFNAAKKTVSLSLKPYQTTSPSTTPPKTLPTNTAPPSLSP